MLINIRKSVFETNSSSSHAVNIDNAESYNFNISKEKLRSGVIEIALGSFDDGAKRYRSFENKLSYVVEDVVKSIYPFDAPEKNDDVTAVFLRNKNGKLIAETVKNVTGCDLKIVVPSYSYTLKTPRSSKGGDYFYNSDVLKNFLCNEESFIQINNDDLNDQVFIKSDLRNDEFFYIDQMVSKDEVKGDTEFKLSFNHDMTEFGFAHGYMELAAVVEDKATKNDFFKKLDGVTISAVKLTGVGKSIYETDNDFAEKKTHLLVADVRDSLRYQETPSGLNILDSVEYSVDKNPEGIYKKSGQLEFTCIAPSNVVSALEEEFLDLCSIKSGYR